MKTIKLEIKNFPAETQWRGMPFGDNWNNSAERDDVVTVFYK